MMAVHLDGLFFFLLGWVACMFFFACYGATKPASKRPTTLFETSDPVAYEHIVQALAEKQWRDREDAQSRADVLGSAHYPLVTINGTDVQSVYATIRAQRLIS